MATVWIARLLRKRGFEKVVAIKTILAKFAEDETFQEMFFDEARLASCIDHPNVAHIHDLGEQDRVLFLVMEYIDGHALSHLRKQLHRAQRPFPIPVALRILADACAGLHAAHEVTDNNGRPLHVVHRDVSPQNIFVSAQGVSKVIDFGVAKAANRVASKTSTGYVKGKVQYMAPEQALAQPVDRRADLWGVGAVLYQLIASRAPFEADNQLALLHLLQSAARPDPLPDSTPAALVEIVARALTHDVDARYQTAAELRAAIEETGLVANHDAVAAILDEHLGAETRKRRQALAAARTAADARAAAAARTVIGIDDIDDMAPTSPNARAPSKEAISRAIAEERTLRRPYVPEQDDTLPFAKQPVLLAAAFGRSAFANRTARVPPIIMPAVTDRASSPQLPAPIETPDLASRSGMPYLPTPIEGPDLMSRSGMAYAPMPIETPDLMSRSGTTNTGVASGGSYGLAAPPPTVVSPVKTPPWLPLGIGMLALAITGAAVGLVLVGRRHPAEAKVDAQSAPPVAIDSAEPIESAAASAPAPPAPPTPDAAADEKASVVTVVDAGRVAPRPPAIEVAREAALRGDAPAVRRALEAKVRRGQATDEEVNLVRQACKAARDWACVDDLKRLYPAPAQP